jgi:hypothetical protein
MLTDALAELTSPLAGFTLLPIPGAALAPSDSAAVWKDLLGPAERAEKDFANPIFPKDVAPRLTDTRFLCAMIVNSPDPNCHKVSPSLSVSEDSATSSSTGLMLNTPLHSGGKKWFTSSTSLTLE